MISQLDISDKFMLSFDVCSLLTSIPSEETNNIICEHPKLLPRSRDELGKLLPLCMKRVHF